MSQSEHSPRAIYTAFVIALGLALSMPGHAAEVRVRNDTGEDLKNVVVGPISFGNLAAGQASQYQSWEGAMEIARVSARSTEGTIGFWPKRPELVKPLGQGYFTYVLTRVN